MLKTNIDTAGAVLESKGDSFSKPAVEESSKTASEVSQGKEDENRGETEAPQGRLA